jgi:AraC-like DNA-binding protein
VCLRARGRVLTVLDNSLTVLDVSVIRGSCLTSYRELVSELGAEPDQILRRAGIRPRDAGDHDVFVSYRGLMLAMESASVATAAPDFGRQLARRQGIEILGPVGVAARTSETMGEGLQICSEYLSAYSPAIAVTLSPLADPAVSFFEFRIDIASPPPAVQTFELSLGVSLAVFRYLCGDDYRPLAVHLPHAPLTSIESYREYYCCAPKFGQPRAGICVPTADLSKAVSEDSQAHQALVRYLEQLMPQSRGNLIEPVRALIEQLLPTGAVSMGLVARQLALHPKSFQRQLSLEGTTFGTLVAETRKRLIEHYLRHTEFDLTQVARQVGYAEQSVLTRSCMRWFGTGPAQLRRHLRSVHSI